METIKFVVETIDVFDSDEGLKTIFKTGVKDERYTFTYRHKTKKWQVEICYDTDDGIKKYPRLGHANVLGALVNFIATWEELPSSRTKEIFLPAYKYLN